jgi:hypothetical protein
MLVPRSEMFTLSARQAYYAATLIKAKSLTLKCSDLRETVLIYLYLLCQLLDI